MSLVGSLNLDFFARDARPAIGEKNYFLFCGRQPPAVRCFTCSREQDIGKRMFNKKRRPLVVNKTHAVVNLSSFMAIRVFILPLDLIFLLYKDAEGPHEIVRFYVRFPRSIVMVLPPRTVPVIFVEWE